MIGLGVHKCRKRKKKDNNKKGGGIGELGVYKCICSHCHSCEDLQKVCLGT